MCMIFNYLSYKDFISNYFDSLPKNGRGQYKRLSEFLGISTVIVSQTLKGEREFTSENAFKTTQFLNLNPLETKYFLKLVEYQKAGHYELKKFFQDELKQLQKESKKVKSSYTSFEELKDEAEERCFLLGSNDDFSVVSL